MSISRQTVEYTAHLARIELEGGQLDKLSLQLQDIINFIDKLGKLDIAGIEPTSHVLPIQNVFRQDRKEDSVSPQDALACAPEKEGHFFKVPKIIE